MTKSSSPPHWDQLVERYFEALTTETEERRLRRFLCSPEGADPRYDDVRAVMGFLAVGRQTLRRPARVRPARRVLHWAAAAALLLLAAGGAGWWITDRQRNVCVAYVDGHRVTDTETVMCQAAEALDAVDRQLGDPTVEQQLNDMFHTLDADTPADAQS